MSVVQALSNEATSVERTTQRIFLEVRSLEADMLRTLSEQTSAEKSTSKTAADIRSLRAAADSEEMLIAEVQNELARLAVDALNTQGHNDRLKQALQLLDAELKDKVSFCRTTCMMPAMPAAAVLCSAWRLSLFDKAKQQKTACRAADGFNACAHTSHDHVVPVPVTLSPQDAAIAKSEVELKRRTDEIERKTRETDNLNRKLERLLAAQPGEHLQLCAGSC